MSTMTVAAPQTKEGAADTEFWEFVDQLDEPTATAPSPIERLDQVQKQPDYQLRDNFEVLADELATETLGMSSTRRAMEHPAFQDILALGTPAIPLIVERLADSGNRPVWLRLLGSLTSFQPGAGQETIDQAALAWIRWSKHKGALR